MNKKGSMGLKDLPSVAFIFLMVGIFFAIAILVLANIQSTSVGVTSNSVTNESITMPTTVNGTVTLAHTYLTSITRVINATGSAYPTANYSISGATTGVVTFAQNTSVACPVSGTCLITYVYDTYGETKASIVITNTITALGEIPNNWLLIIALVIAASIVIGVVVSNIGVYGGGREDNSGRV